MNTYKKILFILFAFLSSTAWAQSLPPISDANMIAAIESSVPSQWSLTWGVPQHLLDGGFLEGSDAASFIQFKDGDGINRATVLAIRTQCSAQNPIGVYPHDYRRCSSIHGRELKDISSKQVGSGWYHEVHMVKHSIKEYEMSFIVEDSGSSYRIDSELFANLYSSACGGNVFNFQIWSDSSSLTEDILSDITSHLNGVKSTSYSNNTSTPVPTATMNYIGVQGDFLELPVESDSAGSGEFTVVAWTYPNPTPNVTLFARQLTAGLQTVALDLAPADALATEFEIYLAIDGEGQDGVLAATNHFGYYSSNWIPFAGPGSTVSIGGVADHPELPLLEIGKFPVNDSDIHLNCALGSNSWCGMYMDIIPEIEDSSILFSAFDTITFDAKKVTSNSLSNYEIKLETESGITYVDYFQINNTWQSFTLPLTGFIGDGGQSWPGDEEVNRFVIAGVSSSPIQASLGFANVAVTRPPRANVSVIGDGGSVLISPTSRVCEDFCTEILPRSTSVTLTPQPDPGHKFFGWSTEEGGQCDTFQLDKDRTCSARFAPEYSAPVLTIEVLALTGGGPDTTRFTIADNHIDYFDWNTLIVRLDTRDVTNKFLNAFSRFAETDPEMTRYTVDAPRVIPGRDLYIKLCRKGIYGGECGEFLLVG